MDLVEHHLDQEALQSLKDIMATDFERLIHAFIADSTRRIAVIRDCYRNNDLETLGQAAHSLKGASANLCAQQLSEYAWQLEQHAREQEVGVIGSEIELLCSEFQTVAILLSDQLQ